MILWRISNYADLKGTGGLKYDGRWHFAGEPIVYLAEHPALALLEVLVHLEVDLSDLPDTYQLLQVEVDGRASRPLSAEALPKNWQNDEFSTQSIGSDWLASESSLLLRVPSAITPYSSNYLYNPKHRDAGKATIIEALHYPWDTRLLSLS